MKGAPVPAGVRVVDWMDLRAYAGCAVVDKDGNYLAGEYPVRMSRKEGLEDAFRWFLPAQTMTRWGPAELRQRLVHCGGGRALMDYEYVLTGEVERD